MTATRVIMTNPLVSGFYRARLEQVPVLEAAGWEVDDDFFPPPPPGSTHATLDDLAAAIAGLDVTSSVRFDVQSLTAPQQAQARTNIGAVGKGDLVINLRDYLADPTGTVASDTAFANAIAAAKDIGPIVRPNADTYIAHDHRGVWIYIPPGNYRIDNPIVLPRSGFYRSHTIGLVGYHSDCCRISASGVFPTGRSLIEWETNLANNNVRDQIIANLTLEPRNATGCRAIYFGLAQARASYGSNVNSVDTMYNVRFLNLIVLGSNDYHQSLIRIEGRYDDGLINNVAADLTLGGATNSTRLLQFDDLSLWSAFSDASYRFLDAPGANFSIIENLQVGHRGGRFTPIYGRVGMGTRIIGVYAGIGANGQNAAVYLRDSAAFVLDSGIFEGAGENGIITLENCQDAEVRNLEIGQTDEATVGAPGSAYRFIACQRITVRGKQSAPGVPAYSSQNSKLARIDSNCRDLRFERFAGTGSFSNEWDIDPAALPTTTIEYLDVTTGRYTVRPRPPGSAALVSGSYVIPPGVRGTGAAAANTEYAIPVLIGDSGPLDRIGVEIVVAGTAGTLIRLGLRDSDANGRPGALLLDAGTVDGATAQPVEAAISYTILRPGWYWLTATPQSTGAQLPSWRVTQFDRPQTQINTLAQALGSSNTSGYVSSATVTGALPAGFIIANRTGIPPLLVARAA